MKQINFYYKKNNITGIISFGDCDQFTDVEADCGFPEKVSCECCTKCYNILTEIPCLDKDTLKISFSEVKKGNPLNYHLLNMRGETVYRNKNVLYVAEKDLEHEACVSPIDCFILKFDEYMLKLSLIVSSYQFVTRLMLK